MKLSEKGMLKLKSFVLIMNNFNVTTEDIEFEPEDFTGAVVLNLHEAKAVLGAYQALAKIYDALEVPDAVECAQESISTIVKRIEQAEAQND